MFTLNYGRGDGTVGKYVDPTGGLRVARMQCFLAGVASVVREDYLIQDVQDLPNKNLGFIAKGKTSGKLYKGEV